MCTKTQADCYWWSSVDSETAGRKEAVVVNVGFRSERSAEDVLRRAEKNVAK